MPSMQMLVPYLQVRTTGDAIAWYADVFGAVETRTRLVAPDGTCMNAEISIGDARVMLADAMPGVGSKALRISTGPRWF